MAKIKTNSFSTNNENDNRNNKKNDQAPINQSQKKTEKIKNQIQKLKKNNSKREQKNLKYEENKRKEDAKIQKNQRRIEKNNQEIKEKKQKIKIETKKNNSKLDQIYIQTLTRKLLKNQQKIEIETKKPNLKTEQLLTNIIENNLKNIEQKKEQEEIIVVYQNVPAQAGPVDQVRKQFVKEIKQLVQLCETTKKGISSKFDSFTRIIRPFSNRPLVNPLLKYVRFKFLDEYPKEKQVEILLRNPFELDKFVLEVYEKIFWTVTWFLRYLGSFGTIWFLFFAKGSFLEFLVFTLSFIFNVVLVLYIESCFQRTVDYSRKNEEFHLYLRALDWYNYEPLIYDEIDRCYRYNPDNIRENPFFILIECDFEPYKNDISKMPNLLNQLNKTTQISKKAYRELFSIKENCDEKKDLK